MSLEHTADILLERVLLSICQKVYAYKIKYLKEKLYPLKFEKKNVKKRYIYKNIKKSKNKNLSRFDTYLQLHPLKNTLIHLSEPL